MAEPYTALPAMIYTDMADNLTKVMFDVLVTESYVPITHYCFLNPRRTTDALGREIEIEPPPPPRQIIDGERGNPGRLPTTGSDLCKSRLSISFIIDALVNGYYVEFCHLEDMPLVKQWIKLYIDQHKDLDLSKFPDRQAFLKNAKEALDILSSNLKRMDEWENEKNPKKLNIQDLISMI